MNRDEERPASRRQGEETDESGQKDLAYQGRDCLLDIKTDYVRNQVKGASFKTLSDRIYHLMKLERWAIRGPSSLAEGYWWHYNKGSIVNDPNYRAIKDELDPEWERKRAERIAEQKRKEEEEKRRREEEEERWLAMEKENWKKMGGSLP